MAYHKHRVCVETKSRKGIEKVGEYRFFKIIKRSELEIYMRFGIIERVRFENGEMDEWDRWVLNPTLDHE